MQHYLFNFPPSSTSASVYLFFFIDFFCLFFVNENFKRHWLDFLSSLILDSWNSKTIFYCLYFSVLRIFVKYQTKTLIKLNYTISSLVTTMCFHSDLKTIASLNSFIFFIVIIVVVYYSSWEWNRKLVKSLLSPWDF